MLTAQPPRYDMFAFIGLYGRKVRSDFATDNEQSNFIMIILVKGKYKETSSPAENSVKDDNIFIQKTTFFFFL
jgi:hypothetical protein